MLGPDHADRWQLSDLVATEPPLRAPLPGGELAPAPAARIREVIDDLINLILRPELAARTPMPRLPASPTLALPPRQLLRRRAGLRPPLLTRLRRILSGRLRTRARVLTRLGLQPRQPLLERRDLPLLPRGQLNQERDTRLTPSVVDHLRLHAVHARKTRCTNQESSAPTPTTERLLDRIDLQHFVSREPPRATSRSASAVTSTPQIGASKVADLQGKIGAPGFKPGTSPTRIMGEILGRCKKSLQIARYCVSSPPHRSTDIAVDSRGLGSEIELLPNRLGGWTSLS